jgi:hypothetical protein
VEVVVVVNLAAQWLVGAAQWQSCIGKAARRGPATNAAVANRSRHYKTRYKTLTLRQKFVNDFNM